MGFRSYLGSYETVLTKNKSVNIQRDIISTLTPAVLMSCLDFAFPIPAKTSVDSKILLIAKFRSFTRNPTIRVRVRSDLMGWKNFNIRVTVTSKLGPGSLQNQVWAPVLIWSMVRTNLS